MKKIRSLFVLFVLCAASISQANLVGGIYEANLDYLVYEPISVCGECAYDVFAKLRYNSSIHPGEAGVLRIVWADSGNSWLGEVYVGSIDESLIGIWKTVQHRVTAPSGAYWMWLIYDGRPSSSGSSMYPIGPLEIKDTYVDLSNNLMDNPGFEEGAYGRINTITIPAWTKWGGSGWIHGDDGPSLDPRGAKTLKLWHQDSGVYQDVTEGIIPGVQYEIGGYVSIYQNDPVVNRKGVIDVEWFNSSGNRIRKDNITRFAGTPGSWKLKVKTLAAPANAVKARIFLHVIKPNAGAPSAGAIHFDDLFIRYD